MEFIAILGDRGAGKTNYLTKKLYDAQLIGERIIANYTLRFPHDYMTFSEIRGLPKQLNRSIIGADELAIGADSYEFFTQDSKEITKFAAEIRKRETVCYFTLQRWSMIARRLRLLTDAFVFMEDVDRLKPVPAGMRHRDVCSGLFRQILCDADLNVVRRPRLFNGLRYWDLYDTNEIIHDDKPILTVDPVDFDSLPLHEQIAAAQKLITQAKSFRKRKAS